MKRKPVIGITGGYVKASKFSEGVYVHQDYHKSISANGGIPIILPYINPQIAVEMIKLCDGIILSGGEDVEPRFYNQEPQLNMGYSIPARDEAEFAIIQYALQHHIPLFAICRGIQILNVALGGTLIQDIPSTVSKSLQHFQLAERERSSHSVTIDKQSELYRILGEEQIRVNSLHHQSIDQVGRDLLVTAWAADGVIEAVEYTGECYVLAVQWHPESMAAGDPLMNQLFVDFLASCREHV